MMNNNKLFCKNYMNTVNNIYRGEYMLKYKKELTALSNDAVFYYYFIKKIGLFSCIVKDILKKSNISQIKILNKTPFLDEFYNKYNVIYVQYKISDKYYYFIFNNIDISTNIFYDNNYILNLELAYNYSEIFSKNPGYIYNIYFINSLLKPDFLCRTWKNYKNEIVEFDKKYIYNIKKYKTSNLDIIDLFKELESVKNINIDKKILNESKYLKKLRSTIIKRGVK